MATFIAGTTFPAADFDVVAVVDSAGTTRLLVQPGHRVINPGESPNRGLYPKLDAEIVAAHQVRDEEDLPL